MEYPAPNTGGEQGGQLRPDNSLLEENPQAEQRQQGLPAVLSVEYPSVRHKDIKPGVFHRHIENPQAEQRQEGLPAVLSVEYPSVRHKDIKPGVFHRHIEPAIIHRDIVPPILHRDIKPPILPRDIIPPTLHRDIKPAILHWGVSNPQYYQLYYPGLYCTISTSLLIRRASSPQAQGDISE